MSVARTRGRGTLTATCSSGGCAAKYAGGALSSLLATLPDTTRPGLLAGLDPPDDGAVLDIGGSSALLLTVDFFPPVVDDPFEFGRISANNALSDVYAMGGSPLLAVSVAAFPEEMPIEVASAIVKGAATQCAAAGAVLAGGHTLRDAEPRFGLAVAGVVDPRRLWRTGGARLGDALFVTKPLGTGLLVSAGRTGRASAADIEEATRWMLESNATAAGVLRGFAPTAVTDVTGFGLLGHAREMALESNVRLAVRASSLPLIAGAERLARVGVRTSGDGRNRALLGSDLSIAPGVDPALVAIGLDPQTAGGLLVAIAPDEAPALADAFRASGVFARQIGFAEPGAGVELRP
jgi:selenide,water dikinase